MRLRHDERGQVAVIVAGTAAFLLVCCALAFDVGSWFHSQRQLQLSIDSAALAGAQNLPLVTGARRPRAAQSIARGMVSRNTNDNPDPRSGTVTVTFPAPTGAGCSPSNCLAVDGSRPTNGLLATALRDLQINGSVTAKARAQAYVGPPGLVKNVNPAAISSDQYCGVGCHTTLTFDNDGFTLLDLNSASDTPRSGGNVSTSQMAGWISQGDPNGVPVDQYYGETTGSKNGLQTSFPDDGTTKMLLPVYQRGSYDVATRTVYVIGFAAFVLDANSSSGSTWDDSGGGNHTLTGKFVKFIAEGLPAGPGTGTDFGVYVVGLNG